MSWNDLDPTYRHLAELHLTPKQLRALKLSEGGLGYRLIAEDMGCSFTTARYHVREAKQKMRRLLEEAA